MLLQRLLERTAERTPEAEAVVTDDRRITYRQLDAEANAVAAALLDAGIAPRDRVAIHLENRAEAVVAIFAVLKAGAAFLMVNPSAKGQKLGYLLRHSEASAVVMPAAKVATLAPILADIESLKTVLTVGDADAEVAGKPVLRFGPLAAAARPRPVVPTIDLDLAALLYTSGSTGEPKGVMLTHANVRAAIESIADYLELTSADTLMNVLPLSFGYGLTQLFSAVRVGARFVLEKGMAYPHVTLSRMAAERVTGFAMVPTIASVLLGLDLGRYDLTSLRYVTNAGAGLPPEYVGRFRKALPHVGLVLMYGQTECLRISYLDPREVDRRPDSVGRGMPNQELSIVDAAGRPVPAGEIGELVVRGAHVTCGYWRMPAETSAALREGRYPGERVLHTADLFRADADGYLYFVSRRDDIIKSKGEKVSPREVENALYRIDGVLEAAVVGVADELLGQAVKAVLVLRQGAELSARDVQRHCAGCLEDFMVPAIVEFADELPKSENGKILKTSLRH